MVLRDRNISVAISGSDRWVESSGRSRSSAAVSAAAPGKLDPRSPASRARSASPSATRVPRPGRRLSTWSTSRVSILAPAIELNKQGPHRLRPTIAGDPQGQILFVVPRGVGEDPHRALEFEVARESQPDVTAGDLALELAGSALGDQMALIEHRDPVREPIG